MNELILRLNGITPNANDFTNLYVSIGNELRIINDADTNINDIIFIDLRKSRRQPTRLLDGNNRHESDKNKKDYETNK